MQKYLQKLVAVLTVIFLALLLQACSPTPIKDFQNFKLPKTPNYYLVCPDKYCNVTPNATSPIYTISAEDLFNAWNQMIVRQPRVHYLYNIPEQATYELSQTTILYILPSDIIVQFIGLPSGGSTLVIYSKSRYGFYDFGGNKRRVQSWLRQLDQIVAQMQNAPSNVNDVTTNEASE